MPAAANEAVSGPPTQLYWGDTHLHTSNSPDASLNGNTLIGPEEAFRFARGEEVTSSTSSSESHSMVSR